MVRDRGYMIRRTSTTTTLLLYIVINSCWLGGGVWGCVVWYRRDKKIATDRVVRQYIVVDLSAFAVCSVVVAVCCRWWWCRSQLY